jgi:crossover junction endodeoxyribonuclease RuvC
MKYLLGIDIGAHGAIAVLDMHLDLVEVIDMPTLTVQKGKKKTHPVDGATLSARLAPYAGSSTLAAIEGSRPGNSGSSMYAFGNSAGQVDSVLSCLGIRRREITPAQWKKSIGLPTGADKDMSRSKAIQHFPGMARFFVQKKDDGRAEAVLIALAVAREIPALVLDLDQVPAGVIAKHLKAQELPLPAGGCGDLFAGA